MSNRNDILEGLKDCLINIPSVKDVVRKFIFFDQVTTFPYLMVLGGDETFDDNLGDSTVSRMSVRIMGYSKSAQEPEKEQCILIGEVLTYLNNTTYNTVKDHMRPIGIETDEGQLFANGDGVSIFVLNLELTYRFERSAP